MVEFVTVATFLVAALASLFMAWSIGAGSSGSTPFAPAVGANAISVMRAGFLVGILGFAGAVLQGANVSETMGGDLIGGVALSPMAATIALIIAATLVAIGVFLGYPIATAFTSTGAVIGAGLAMGGTPAWATYTEIAAMWILTPFVGSFFAYVIARALREEPIPERYVIVGLAGVVGLLIANIEFAILGPPDGGASLAETASAMLPGSVLAGIVAGSLAMVVLWMVPTALAVRNDPARAQRRFLLVMGGLVAFSAGGSQVGLAIGPLIPMSGDVGLPITALLVGGGVGLLIGSWTGAPRMIKAISQDYSSLGPRRSIAALIPSFAIAQAAVLFGIPVSFNEIVVSSIIGSGYAAAGAGGGGVSARKMGLTVLAWFLSLVGSIIIAYGGYVVIDLILF
ncbi:inorganic phosphate transporter [Natronorubrum daqingense]|uniref:Phosphate transporter n=1 Tax=Natronorubrum daqingense TaxID=588898 RepID=A0A1N7EPV5_9EURY|nr:inorganic phosphate transporter [Natronorubrum daqingense]APX97805.1 anion permease [Natronorubrum daqingense]SIR90118.1 inorganic phosphate transporter, PiT family [Natronorubrum daqingense]